MTDQASRVIFLANFEKEGSGKGGFKWVNSFEKSLKHNTEIEVASTEDVLTKCQILKLLGVSIVDFKTNQEAFSFANVEIARNKEEYGHEGYVEEHALDDMHHRYQFIQSHGKKRSWKQTEGKEIRGSASLSSVQALKQAKQFMEAIGPADPETSGEGEKQKNVIPEEQALILTLAEHRHIHALGSFDKHTREDI